MCNINIVSYIFQCLCSIKLTCFAQMNTTFSFYKSQIYDYIWLGINLNDLSIFYLYITYSFDINSVNLLE